MRIYIAGASGVIGRRLAPLLSDAGHEVAGMTRSPEGAELLASLGARPFVCDVYDVPALTAALQAFRPAVVIDQLTDLPDDPRRIADLGSLNARMRREGSANLLATAQLVGTSTYIAQSVAWPLPGDAGAAVTEMEARVLAAEGVVLRYGQIYGPGTYHEAAPPDHPRIHVDEVAERTAAALDLPSGVYEVVEGL